MSNNLSFSGCVFDDLNSDGIVLQRDANGDLTNQEEAGFSGVTVRVLDANGNAVTFQTASGQTVTSTTTTAQGFYYVYGLDSSDYKIQFDYQGDSDLTQRGLSPADVVDPALGVSLSEFKDSDGITQLSAGLVETGFITAGTDAATKVNLGLTPDPGTARIGNRVFLDANGNGILDNGESGVNGVRVTLSGAGADGQFGTGDDITRVQDINNDGGFYGFDGLDAGQYKVTFDNLPDGAAFTTQDVGNDEHLDSDVDVNTGMTDVIDLAAGQQLNNVDAGIVVGDGPVDPGTARIGNRVFLDENGNGILDNGESGVNGVRVTLSGAGADGQFGTGDDITRVQDINNDGGFYGFDGLDAGQYKVSFDNLPDGAAFTTQDVGNDEHLDSDVDVATGMTDVIDLAAGQQLNNVDAGIVSGGPVDPGTARIGNRVFLDENGNGILDNGESGVNGVRVTLSGAGADGQFGTGDDITRVQDINNEGGFYGFDGLDAGQYKVSFDNLPDGAAFTTQDVGNDEHLDSDVDVATGMTDVIDLAAGQQLNNVDAGIVSGDPVDPGTARIGNRVFLDENGNGILDNGESGVNGVRVTLSGAGADGQFGTGDDITRVQDINNDGGFYGFDGLDAGQYKVTFDNLPDGATFTTQDAGNDEHLDSDADVNTGMTDVIDLAAGQQLNNVDAGIIAAPSNIAPDAVDDSDSTAFNTAVTLDLLSNDADLDGDALSVTSLNGQSVSVGDVVDTNNGFVTLLGNGEVSFTPDNGFVGNESFSYHISDGNGGEDTANVLINVAPAPNAAPNATDDSGSTDFNTDVTLNVLGNDADPDGDALSVTSLNGEAITAGQPVFTENGAVTLLDNGQLSFSPDAGFVGDETFSYHVSDGNGGEDTANVTVTVAPEPNSAPNAADDGATTDFNTAVSIDVLGNDADPDGDALDVTSLNGQSIAAGETVATDNGSVTLLNNGQLSFTPDDGFTGTESFSYHVSDGNGGEDTANVTVNVDPAPIDYNASLVGNSSIHEGGKGTYFVELNEVSDRDRVFTLKLHNGSAKRRDGNINGQDVNGASFGGYSVGYSAYNISYFVYGRVPNGTSLSAGDRPQVGPSAQNWDFNVTKNGQLNYGNTIQVTVEAGETRSESIHVNAAKEKVTIDRFLTPHGYNDHAIEGTENFSIKIADAGDATVTTGRLDVNINDKTHYSYVSPITLDLGGDGIQTLGLEAGVEFDLLNTGEKVRTGWISGEDGFLAVDANSNGRIDDRSELFGGSVGEGFGKLASYDSNSDGWVNASDAAFGELRIWQDANENGLTENGELVTLAAAGIESLSMDYASDFSFDDQGNVLGERSVAQTTAGQTIDMIDVYFQVAEPTAALGSAL